MLRQYQIGSDFAGYRIDVVLGRGGMGEVYKAENPRLGTALALKVLNVDLTGNEIFRERFIREARAAASLDHPNVIPVFDVDEHDGIPYIAMRYVEGRDLKTVIQQEGPLSVERTLALLEPVASALDWAHPRGLIHRDVKPANILIEERAGARSDHVYLSDFGVAKSGITQGLTSPDEFVGTIEYVAPEQIRGKKLDGRSDIYALGCIVFECLSGVVPFDRDSAVSLMYAHLEEPPPRLTEHSPGLPGELDDVIRIALAKSPDERYSTGAALMGAVRAAAEGSPVSRLAPPTVITQKPPVGETVVRPREEIVPEPEPVPVPVVQPSAGEGSHTVVSTRTPELAPTVEPNRRRVSRRFVAAVLAALISIGLAAGAARAILGGNETTTPTVDTTGGASNGEGESDPPAPDPEPPTPPPERCRVTNVTGLTLPAATRRLTGARCRLGVVRRRYSAKVGAGRVISQRPAPGHRLRVGARVNVALSRGERPPEPEPPDPQPPDPQTPDPQPPDPCKDRIRCPDPPPPPPCDPLRGC
jgi:serine/threonine-protein kinase